MAIEDFYKDDKVQTKLILFGCSVKSITFDQGVGNQSSTMIVTVVQEEGQAFTIPKMNTPTLGIHSLTFIKFGSLEFNGVIESWEQTIVDISGKDIFVIRMTDVRQILATKEVVLALNDVTQFEDTPEGEEFLRSIITVFPEEPNTGGVKTGFDNGVRYSKIREKLEESDILFGGGIFRVDLSELTTIVENQEGPLTSNVLTGGLSDSPQTAATRDLDKYRVTGKNYNMLSLITKMAHDHGVEWFVDLPENSKIIKIRIIDFTDGETPSPPQGFETIEDMADALHPDRVIRHTEGFEHKPAPSKDTRVLGPAKTKLRQISGYQFISPFWGWKENTTEFIPLAGPTVNGNERISMLDLETGLNNLFDDDDDRNQDRNEAIRAIAEGFWGKKFLAFIDDSAEGLLRASAVGWWEEDGLPANLQAEGQSKLSTVDGRWFPFIKMPRPQGFFGPGGGESSAKEATSIDDRAAEFHISTLSSNNVAKQDGRYYMKATLDFVADKFIIITLPDPLETVNGAGSRNRQTNIPLMWLPLQDLRENYGPFVNPTPLIDNGFSAIPKVVIDAGMVPWRFGGRGVTNEEGMANLTTFANARFKNLGPGRGVGRVVTGQLEVADLPKANVGLLIGDGGGAISQVSVSLGIQGVTTRYAIKLLKPKIDNTPQQENFDEDIKESIGGQTTEDEEPAKEEAKPTPRPEAGKGFKDIFIKPEDFSGKIISAGGGIKGGPLYGVRGLGATVNSLGTRSATQVQNLAEPDDSPGILPINTRVTVKYHYSGPDSVRIPDDFAGGIVGTIIVDPFMEQTPQTFSPPKKETT